MPEDDQFPRYADATPVIRQLLSCAQWFGDRSPVFAHMWAAQEARERSEQTIRFCRKYSCTDVALESIEARLRSCTEGARCLSGACPMCARAQQRAHVQLGRDAFRQGGFRTSDLRFLSLVHGNWRVELGHLKGERVSAIHRHMQELLGKTNLTVFIGGFDLSANWTSTNRGRSHYQLQLAGIAAAADWDLVGRTVRKLFPKRKTIPRPVQIKFYDGRTDGFAYCLKPEFLGRESYLDLNPKRDDRGPCRNTRSRPLRGHERIEVIKMLDQVGLAKRQILRGAHWIRTKKRPSIAIGPVTQPDK